ncbi:MAG: 50S ribosomal protein L24 [Tissierellia bacterium]|nr:50S ribosomal protein L24 [Tissierellia bacterium]
MRIKTGDNVIIIAGKDKGKTGKVLKALPKENRVIVEGINMITKHMKTTSPTQPGGIQKLEAPIHVSNVMFYDEKNKKGSRVGYKIDSNGNKSRVAKTSGETIK